jgi:hypothetical protein
MQHVTWLLSKLNQSIKEWLPERVLKEGFLEILLSVHYL